jgi:hypothetical protein
VRTGSLWIQLTGTTGCERWKQQNLKLVETGLYEYQLQMLKRMPDNKEKRRPAEEAIRRGEDALRRWGSP